MNNRTNIHKSFFKEHFWGLLLIVVLLIVSSLIVKSWKAKHPGAMSVLESQAMDMTVMKPPVGSLPVATEVIHIGKFSSKVSYTGSVAPFQQQIVYPRVEGYLKNLSVYNGDSVHSGKIIAVIDSPDLQSKVAEAYAGKSAAQAEIPIAQNNVKKMAAEKAASESDINIAKAELAKAKSMVAASEKLATQKQKEVNAAKANLDYWNIEIDREEKLFKAGAVSAQEYQLEKSQAATAKGEYESKIAMLAEAKDNVNSAKADVSSKQSELSSARQKALAASAALKGVGYEINQKTAMAKQAGAMLATASSIDQYRYIKSPFSGIIGKRYLSPGQFVNQSTAIVSIVQIDKVRLQVNVPDSDLNNIKIGSPIIAHFNKYPNLKINAKVTSISPISEQSSRTVIVEALIPNSDHKLMPGDSVTLDITTSQHADAISVPVSAIVQKNGKDAVWIVRNEVSKDKAQYYCTMHPEIVRDKPGTCPICHMDLVPKESSSNKKAHLVMVTTGINSGDRIQIIAGLSDGDEVIYQGNTYLQENVTVFPTKWSSEGPIDMPKPPSMDDSNGMENMPGMDHDMQDMPGMDGR